MNVNGIKIESSHKIILNEDQVKEALKLYIESKIKTNTEVSLSSMKLDIEYRQEEIPGIDPHDCDYVKIFTGIEVKF